MDTQIKALLITIAVSAVLFSLVFISSDPGVLGNAVILSTFIIAVPQLLFRYERYKTIKEMETKFPAFLRDMVESIRSGMPFHQSIVIASSVDYGKLSKEVKKMANQISWGIPFNKVIEQFADRVKKSKRLNTGLRTIREAYMSGGDVISTLESVADTAVILDEAEKERKSLLSQYVVLMYGISFLFLGIVAGINRLMVPIFEISMLGGGIEDMGIQNPCDKAIGFGSAICDGLQSTCGVFGIEDPLSIGCYYTSLFFSMSMVVAACSGIVAGQIGENSVIAGLKHSIILTAITFGAFNILVRLGIMGI